MHKLLVRQLEKYLKITSITPDLSKELAAFIQAIDEAYLLSEEENAMLERSLDFASKELLQRNATLTKTLEELKEAQGQLVHSGKMAALGQLVAGVAHEINTPASAINSAIDEIKTDYSHHLEQILELGKTLSEQQLSQYLELCKKLIPMKKNSSTMERRQIGASIQEKLAAKGIEIDRTEGQNLASIGFTADTIDEVADLLTGPQANLITDGLFNFGMSQIHVEDVKIAIGRITQLVKALKLYTHSDQDSFSETNLKEDIENTLLILHNRLKRAVNVHTEFETIPPIKCYSDQLTQVWTNLINNSIESMKGDGNLYIRLKKGSENQVIVEVEDDGPGIPPEVLPHIFKAFYTTKIKGEGTGLGLSICKDIINKHHGKIEIESVPGRTLFRIIIPSDLTIDKNSGGTES